MINGRRAEITKSPEIVPFRARHQVRRKLHFYKPVVRNIVINGLDHPISIAPRERIGWIGRLGCRIVFGKARHVEPVPRPAFAILGRSQ